MRVSVCGAAFICQTDAQTRPQKRHRAELASYLQPFLIQGVVHTRIETCLQSHIVPWKVLGQVCVIVSRWTEKKTAISSMEKINELINVLQSSISSIRVPGECNENDKGIALQWLGDPRAHSPSHKHQKYFCCRLQVFERNQTSCRLIFSHSSINWDENISLIDSLRLYQVKQCFHSFFWQCHHCTHCPFARTQVCLRID